MSQLYDNICTNEALNLSELFTERVKRSKNKVAYQYFDHSKAQWKNYSWDEIKNKVILFQHALTQQNLTKGQCVAVMLKNCPEWVMFEQAALSLGLVIVPLYTNDRPHNISYIINDSKIKVLLVTGNEQCSMLETIKDNIKSLKLIVSLEKNESTLKNVIYIKNWLDKDIKKSFIKNKIDKNQLASIVYTSGTTGRPKGVMLSHNNILQNAFSASQCDHFHTSDIFLSFLPLSHMFERTAGYYLPMISGSKVVYARSVENLAEDLINIKPTILITVPRIFERFYNKINLQLKAKSNINQILFDFAINVGWHCFLYSQNRIYWHPKMLLRSVLAKVISNKVLEKLGGNLRLTISGGAALAPNIARTFIGLGLNISQGYGMTEASPIVCTNLLHNNEPYSVGQKLDNVDVKLGENDELLVKGPNIMLGYLNNKEATNNIIDKEGWLHSGDKAKIINNHIYITGRIKDILVLSTGEKIPPNDIEISLTNDPLIEQAIVFGENRPFLISIIVLNKIEWQLITNNILSDNNINLNSDEIHQFILNKIKKCLHYFPGYTRIYKVFITTELWTVENGLVTPTLKQKRINIFDKYQKQIDTMYKGH